MTAPGGAEQEGQQRAEKRTAILDCNIFFQAAISGQGPAAALVRDLEADRFQLIISDEVVREVKDVLNRPRLREKFPALTDERADGLIALIEAKGVRYENVPFVFEYARDPNDEKYLNLAAQSQAGSLVTRDKDLLSLAESAMFREQCPRTTILDPVEFRRELTQESPQKSEPEPEQQRQRGPSLGR